MPGSSAHPYQQLCCWWRFPCPGLDTLRRCSSPCGSVPVILSPWRGGMLRRPCSVSCSALRGAMRGGGGGCGALQVTGPLDELQLRSVGVLTVDVLQVRGAAVWAGVVRHGNRHWGRQR